MATSWDAQSYDRTSAVQQGWAADVVGRLSGIAPDARVLDVGCGTGRVTETLVSLVPDGEVLAIDASAEMVELARARLGEGARVWCTDVLDLELEEPVDAIVSTATLHWVRDHERLWPVLARALRPGGRLEVQCGGEGNIARVRAVIDAVVREGFPELEGFMPWTFSGPGEAGRRLRAAGFEVGSCWLAERPADPEDLGTFVRTSILPAHLAELPEERRQPFAAAVLARVRAPLDYVRLNVSAVRRA
ncbi:MAG TPA: class I SAM-dependent methyltransferase [Solirubrobacteraceae bacterium]|jgi:trans-aconitate 2-methyltransferase|nr:class I SAM-dependent methyltransferase [Solirubrobacteraceae bacterium]